MSSEQFKHLPPIEIAHMDFYSPEQAERVERLHAIKRFGAIKEMTHRTSVWEHTLRVSKHSVLFSKILLVLGVNVDLRRVLFLADHHDDVEIETDDIPTPTKRSATKEQKTQMEADERAAARKVDRLVQKPWGFSDFPKTLEEYKAQKSLEARIVDYADKWDCLHEAVHEVVCGENKIGFKEVIYGYKPTFEDLNKRNEDWQEKLKSILGNDFFDFPDPEKLVPKSPEQLDYATVGNFIKSVAQGNPKSYFFWLRFNKSAFGLDFLKRTFPGWMDRFPQAILKDIERVKDQHPFKTTASGLWIPSTEINIGNLTFGESMKMDLLATQLIMAANLLSSAHQ